MSKREPELLLADMLEAIGKIKTYTAALNFKQFKSDDKTIDAVVRNLEIIGEASRMLPEEFTKRNPHIAWYQIIGIRNRIIHAYFGVDLKIIWQVVKEDLPVLEEALHKVN